ncbi:hypothetical protein HIM_09154 [Hirsutella minnesotensis 3608]|uniref:S-adenosylmethionine:tRNA ribosyltransferase-isomerase n=1 Tax=Hirsutella minnesotensis 3608 TaxID=1043627 RepID=A0A0F7ZLS8_9HYPO|nr:hypothetical protein HIM_09154 [Hirsutella minnesotensis 3608]
MKTQEFNFNLDPRVMPHDPVELRGKSRDSGRMIVLDRSAGKIEHTVFSTICDHFRPGDLLVLNDSYMLSNTLSFQHGDDSAQVTMYGFEPDDTTIVEIKSEQVSVKPGLALTSTNDDRLTCSLLVPQPYGFWKARFEPFQLLVPTLDQYGQRLDEDTHPKPTSWKAAPQAYRSVYAQSPGSLEIPWAGLHFSKELLTEITAKGVEIAHITMDVGATGTFAVRHIIEEEVEDHRIGYRAAAQISRALAERRRIIAVGTKVMLAADRESKTYVEAQGAWADLYIYPGHDFKVVDVLLTNLQQPRSSHIVLTAASAGKDFVMRSYADFADKGGYEFDMFGDCMV